MEKLLALLGVLTLVWVWQVRQMKRSAVQAPMNNQDVPPRRPYGRQ